MTTLGRAGRGRPRRLGLRAWTLECVAGRRSPNRTDFRCNKSFCWHPSCATRGPRGSHTFLRPGRSDLFREGDPGSGNGGRGRRWRVGLTWQGSRNRHRSRSFTPPDLDPTTPAYRPTSLRRLGVQRSPEMSGTVDP